MALDLPALPGLAFGGDYNAEQWPELANDTDAPVEVTVDGRGLGGADPVPDGVRLPPGNFAVLRTD